MKNALSALQLMSRDELGQMYFDLQDEYSKWLRPWSNWLFQSGDPEVRKKELKDKMAAIHAELGEDFIALCQLRQDHKKLQGDMKDVGKNNDELENRIERLENCIVELYSHKQNKPFRNKDPHYQLPFGHCESKIPMDTHPSHLISF